MNYDLQVRQRQDNLPEAFDPYASTGGDGQGEQQEGVFIKLHRLLRGRYIWAVLLGVVLGAAGAYYGYKSKQPMWSSTGMIHIRPYIAPLLRPSDSNGDMRSYTSYVFAQVAFLKMQRVIDSALQAPEWRVLNRPGTNDEVWQDFLGSLQISAGGDEMVMVTFTDPDAAACSAAVKGVLRAYSSLYLENDERQQEEKLQRLDSMRIALTSERDAKREAIRSIAREFATDDLRPMLQTKQKLLAELELKLSQIESELATALRAMPATQPATQGKAGASDQKAVRKAPKDMTVSDIAMVDARMRQMCDDLQEIEERINLVLRDKGPNHPQVRDLRDTRDVRQRAIDRYAGQWRTTAASQGYTEDDMLDPATVNRRQLEKSRREYQDIIQSRQKEVRDMGNKMLEIDRLRLDEHDKEVNLAEVVTRIDTLRTESKAAGRVEIVSWGDRPVRMKDPRPKSAAMFGMGGFASGVVFVVILCLLDRRMRSLDDARTSIRLPLLGILPELPQDLADPEQASMAAHCVHQIRTLLQIGQRGEQRRTFAITSPAAGTGKTSLTLALGVSFAAASSKTLIIDCDVVGGGLTARIETIIRRKIGQILKRDGAITEQQLDTALRLAHNSQRKLGEILVELGYLSPDDVDRALAVQQDGPPVGMLDALSGEPIDDCVAETGIQDLCILPVGGAMPSDVSKLSPQALRNLLARARERFDIILIDTGPVPGSLEASAAATAADGVILVVSRGEHRPLVERSLQYLQDLGARLSGMVFNRAADRDVDAATTTTRLTSIDRTGRAHAVTPQEHVDSKFGPIAGAVATSSPASKSGTRPQQQS